MIPKTLRQALPAFVILLGLTLLPFCSSSKEERELVTGKPVFQGFVPETVKEIEISLRPLSDSAWRVRLKREGTAEWKLTERSDLPGVSDLADSALIEHFLRTLSTFNTELKAGKGRDESFGFTPYRADILLNNETHLYLGDPTENAGIFFRLKLDGATYVGRGAWVALLGHIQTPAAFQFKSAFLGLFENYQTLELEKLEGKDRGRWIFNRAQGQWATRATPTRELSEEQLALIERIFRHRILRIVLPDEAAPVLPKKPDWIFRIDTEGDGAEGRTQPQEIKIYFILDQVFAVNPQRGIQPVEFYPELAGALRAFTQSGFTRVKFGIK